MKYRFLYFLISFLFISVVHAQSLEETIGGLAETGAKEYVAPVVSGFGANLNSGWLHKATAAKKFGIDIELGVVFMGTIFGDANKSFSTSGSFRFDRPQAEKMTESITNAIARDSIINRIINSSFNIAINGPTITGKNTDTVFVSFPGQTYNISGLGSYTVPGQNVNTGVTGVLEELSILPLAAPQLSVGTVYGTSLSLRYVPNIKINEDLGEFKYLGFGLQHNPAIWFPNPLPLDLSVGYFTQTLEVGKIFKTEATTFGLYASKSFGWSLLSITPYAGFSLESSNITVTYDFVLEGVTDSQGNPDTKVPVKFELEGKNKNRFILGAALKLGIINLNVDYNISEYNVVSAGLGFIF